MLLPTKWGGALLDDTKNGCVADYYGRTLNLVGYYGILGVNNNRRPLSSIG